MSISFLHSYEECSPLHYDEETFLPLVNVLIQVEYSDDVGTSGYSPVQLNLPSGFRSIIQDLLHITKTQADKNASVSKVLHQNMWLQLRYLFNC